MPLPNHRVEGAQATNFCPTVPDFRPGTMVLARARGRRQGSSVVDLRARDGPTLLRIQVEASMEDDLVVAVRKAKRLAQGPLN